MSIHIEHIAPRSMNWETSTFFRSDSPHYLALLGEYYAILTHVYDEAVTMREGERWMIEMMESVVGKNGRPMPHKIFDQYFDQGVRRREVIVGRSTSGPDFNAGHYLMYVTVQGWTH